MDATLGKLYNKNYNSMINYGKNTFDYEYFGVFYEVEGVLNSKLNFAGLKEEEIKEVLETPVAGLKLSERLYDKHLNDIKLKVKGAITEGLINNKGYGELAKNLSDIGNSNYNNNVKIAVTEAGRIKSLAKQKGLEEAVKSGVSLKKKWIAVSDKKTRADHQQLNGQVADIDEKFHLHGYSASQPRLFGVAKEDMGCRCDCETVVEEAYNEATNSKESIEAKKYDSFDEWYKDRVSKNEGLDGGKSSITSIKDKTPPVYGQVEEGLLDKSGIRYNGVNGAANNVGEKYDRVTQAYTGGRTQVELDDLARDPSHGFKIEEQGLKEREIGLALEERGDLGRIIRDTQIDKGAEFIDTTTGLKWDVKSFESYPMGRNGIPITKVKKGAFSVDKGMEKIYGEFDKGNNIIIDKRLLIPEHIIQLKEAIKEAGIGDRIIWYP
ncbi:hypothetical protein JHL18_02100 [Clostridium sp. YIM B02505]|uniref:Phage head morphogenesis domain-containing protein n=1 Tax=Clostridium yunnanense TaxID=2800325 RepID=A0ABS1EJ92_9CLOT|nr:phage minor head protein [Clostridium yunnanense]MBK1809439.1 hypothetical protein [Clostridium yunnanense]